jgi:hypothetical protein
MMNVKQHKQKVKKISQGFFGKEESSHMNIFPTLSPKKNMQPKCEQF